MGSALSVHGHNVKVTEVVKDGDVLTFLIVSEKVRKQLSASRSKSYLRVKQLTGHEAAMLTRLLYLQLTGTGEYHVHRTYDDFEWLQQHLFSQEEEPGIQGVIVSTSFHPQST